MPRSARIDLEGVLQHVMIRGIEKRDIFVDDHDRSAFVDRLSKLLVKAKTDCLAWSLLSNHAHLLLRPTKGKLSEMMRRLLTGYAVVFNLRHHRSGHLFQNRYKSVVCEEDSYLLELVRYIHLNPVRAGLVKSMENLETFKWSGHAVLLGHAFLPGQAVDEVLQMFDNNKNSAAGKYRDFVAEGIALGRREELVGGGLKRYLKFSGSHDFEAYDERILGSGEFVEQLWQETEQSEVPAVPPPPLDEVIERVATVFGIDAMTLRHGSKEKHLSDARGAICYIAIRKFGYNGVELSKSLGLSGSGIVLAARRGEGIFHAMPSLREITALK
jgi:REP element-mobilizing transposase RayT